MPCNNCTKVLTEAVEGLCEPRVSGLQSLEAAEAVIKM